MDMRSPKLIAIAVAALLVLAAGAWAYSAHQARKQREATIAFVREGTAELRKALGTGAGPQPVAAIDAAVAGLRGLGRPRRLELADASEQYLLSAKAIAQRRADATRLAPVAAASRRALESHMGGAARRDSSWIRDALELKKQMERDYFDQQSALKALDDLLWSLPEAQKRLVAALPEAVVLEEPLRLSAKQQALAELKRAEDELAKARLMGAPR
jgi:hypothetical protein